MCDHLGVPEHHELNPFSGNPSNPFSGSNCNGRDAHGQQTTSFTTEYDQGYQRSSGPRR